MSNIINFSISSAVIVSSSSLLRLLLKAVEMVEISSSIDEIEFVKFSDEVVS